MGRHKQIYRKMSSITHLPKREYTEFHMEKFLEGLYMEEFLRGPVEKAKELMLINPYITMKDEPLNEWLDGKSEIKEQMDCMAFLWPSHPLIRLLLAGLWVNA